MSAPGILFPRSSAAVGISLPRLKEELVSFAAPGSPGAEQYRGLRHSVERLHRDSGVQVIAVTSPGPGDGKTITSLNLAGSLAQSSDARVLLVDADLHKASVSSYLGLSRHRGPGLAEAIADKSADFVDAVRRLDTINLSVMQAGAAHPRPHELLSSTRLEGLIGEMRQHFDYILIDTPPVVPVSDCRFLGRWVDGFIVVVAAHRTPRKMVAEAVRLLDGNKLLGIVFNGDDGPLRSYYKYYGAPAPSDPPIAG